MPRRTSEFFEWGTFFSGEHGRAPVLAAEDLREKRGDRSSPLLSTAAASVCVAAGWCCRIVRVRAEWPQSGFGLRNTEHGKRSGLMLAVERRGLGRIEVAAGQSRCIQRIVKPEAQMERVRRSQAHVGIKTEDIVQKNRFDLDMAVIRLFANLDIGLIPSQTKASREIGILGAIGLKKAVLDGEQVKRETRLDPVQVQNERVVLLATNNRGVGPRLFERISTKTVNDRRVRQQVESDLVLRILGGNDAGSGQDCERRKQSTHDAANGSTSREFLAAIVVQFFSLLF